MRRASWSARLSAPWSATYSPLRGYWLLRGLYLLLSADLWFDMIEHGGRYGVGGFNVAHFEWLGVLFPVPSPALYVGLLIAAGGVSLLLALGPQPRWLRLCLVALYTLSWMLSIHDSYQHHYLLSWLLLWCSALPELSAERALSREPALGWGLPMTCVTCSIVYFFTGIAKSEPDWRGGAALRAITHSAPVGALHPGKFDGARDLLMELGLADASVWQLFALSTIALQWLIALGYLAGSARDAKPSRTRLVLCTLGLLAALSFHAVAELFHVFEIGLFSYYMMFVACVLLAPAALWRLPTAAVAWGSARLSRVLGSDADDALALSDLARPLLSALLLCGVGFVIPLPGAPAATCAMAAVVLLSTLLALRAPAGQTPTRGARLDALAFRSTVAALLSWLSLTQTSVPFDYYRRTAGELYRMGERRQSLALYRQAERYAPSDQSRASRIRELERELQQDTPSSENRRF